ncbi:MAG: sigma-54-dependent transcriptional regulator [bacterium]
MATQRILVVDDEPEIRNSVRDILEDEGFQVALAENTNEARSLVASQSPDLVLLDIWMPGEDGVSLLKEWSDGAGLPCPVIMMSGHGTVETAVEATRLGAFDFIEKPLSLAKLLRASNRALDAVGRNKTTENAAGASPSIPVPVGSSAEIVRLREQYEKAAQHDSLVFLMGESGTGKTHAAKYIHSQSSRAKAPFVEVACSSLGEDLEDELFGNVSGEVEGYFQQARGGTLYLSEVADLDLSSQAALLAALEQKTFSPVGGSPEPLTFRLMVSTQHDISRRVKEGLFREDLFYHLNVLLLRLPALREHAEDVPALLQYFVDAFNAEESLPFRHFSLGAQNYLRYYSWPGNIRQLRNLVQRLLILGEGPEIDQAEVEEALVRDRVAQAQLTAGLPQEVMELPLREAREIFEREYLSRQLELCQGNVSRLADRVGMERTHLYRKMRALGISPRKN